MQGQYCPICAGTDIKKIAHRQWHCNSIIRTPEGEPDRPCATVFEIHSSHPMGHFEHPVVFKTEEEVGGFTVLYGGSTSSMEGTIDGDDHYLMADNGFKYTYDHFYEFNGTLEEGRTLLIRFGATEGNVE